MSSSYPLSALTDDPYPIHCRSGFYDGFSGWYAVSNVDKCEDFCFWEVYGPPPEESAVAAAAEAEVSSASDGGVIASSGVPEWACALDMNSDCARSRPATARAVASSSSSLGASSSSTDGGGGSAVTTTSDAHYSYSSSDYGSSYSASNTADPHLTTSIPGIAEWRCALSVSSDASLWKTVSSNPQKYLSAVGEFGPTFEYTRCSKGGNEVLNDAGRKVANSMAFFGCMLALFLCGSLGMGVWLWIWRRQRKKMEAGDGDAGGVMKGSGGKEDDDGEKNAESESEDANAGAAESAEASTERKSSSHKLDDPSSLEAAVEDGAKVVGRTDTSDDDEMRNEGHGGQDVATTGDDIETTIGATGVSVFADEKDAPSSGSELKSSKATSPPSKRTSWVECCACCRTAKCRKCRKCCSIASLVFLAIFLLFGVAWTSMNIHELRGANYSDSGTSKLTAKCVDSSSVCAAGNSDIERPSRPHKGNEDEDAFSYLVASDPQLNWWDGESASLGERNVPIPCDEQSDNCGSCTDKLAEYTNTLMKSVLEGHLSGNAKTAGGAGVTPSTVVMNGDFTAYFHPYQRSDYQSYYHTLNSGSGPFSYFPALGNHDYAQFSGARYSSDQWFGPPNCNSRHAIGYMRGGFCGKIPGFDPDRVVRYDSDSLAYSWEEGRYHFVHLQYHPAFESATAGIKLSVTWLDRDLTVAKEANLTSVIFVHAAQGLPIAAENAILGKNVKAIFAGHSHRCFMRKCFFLRALGMSEVFPDEMASDPNFQPTEEDIASTSKPAGSDKCVPGTYALCGGKFTGGGGMNLWYVSNRTTDSNGDPTPPLPATKLYYQEDIKPHRKYCAPPDPVFVNTTDNTLLCRGIQVGYRTFPPLANETAGEESIPVFWSGSSSFETFLKVDFRMDRIVVNSMTAKEGTTVKNGGRFVDNVAVPNAVYPYHDKADVEEATVWIE